LHRINYDGTDHREFYGDGTVSPHGLAADYEQEMLYWVDGRTYVVN